MKRRTFIAAEAVQMKWFIPVKLVEYCKRNEANSFIKPREIERNELALFNKNTLTYQYFNNVRKDTAAYAYIGEADSINDYFSREIRPFHEVR